MRITEMAAYLKGLVDGLELDSTTKEGKVISKMLEVIEEMAIRINDLEDDCDNLYDYVEEMATDIVSIEEDLYDDEAEYDDLDDLLDEEDDYDLFDDEDYYEIECPSCGEVICFSAEVDLDELACPACGELIGEIELCDEDCESCPDKESCEQE